MPETARWIGGFVRWLLKGCKTNLKDEIFGRFEPSWGRTYDFENFIIGIITILFILIISAIIITIL
jgi:hypothetical protein